MSARMLLRSPAGAGEGSLLPDEERDGPPGSRSEAGCSWASPAFEVEPAHEGVAREWLDWGVVAEEVELPAALSVVLPQHAGPARGPSPGHSAWNTSMTAGSSSAGLVGSSFHAGVARCSTAWTTL